MIEEWGVIKDFPDYYVSDFGRVKSLKFGRNNILKARRDKYGYLFVLLYGYKNKNCSIHRLVLKVFNPIENPENFQCNHINGIKNDNRLENLEWCTPSENIKHAYRIGLAINAKKGILLSDETKRKMSENHKDVNGEKNPNCRLSNEDLIKIKELLMEGILSQRKIAKIYSVHNTTISRIKRGVTRKHLY